MKKNTKTNDKKRIIIFLAIVLAILIIGIIIVVNNISSEENIQQDNESNVNSSEVYTEYESTKQSIDMPGTENVFIEDDGTIINTSEKLESNKEYNNCVIDVVSVEYTENNSTEIKTTITNNSDETVNLDFVNMNILDSDGNVFSTIKIYIGEISANYTKSVSVSTQADITNLSDFEILPIE